MRGGYDKLHPLPRGRHAQVECAGRSAGVAETGGALDPDRRAVDREARDRIDYSTGNTNGGFESHLQHALRRRGGRAYGDLGESVVRALEVPDRFGAADRTDHRLTVLVGDGQGCPPASRLAGGADQNPRLRSALGAADVKSDSGGALKVEHGTA